MGAEPELQSTGIAGEYRANVITASQVRLQIESTLSRKIPSALTPQTRMVRPVMATGVGSLDDLLHGGFPVGALCEMTGPECSGRTSVALSLIGRLTDAGKVCAWVDVSNALDPASAAAVGVNLARLLWVRCGVQQSFASRSGQRFALPEKYLVPRHIKKGLHGGGFGPHPRTEVRGMADAVGDLLAPSVAERQHQPHACIESHEKRSEVTMRTLHSSRRSRHYDAIEQGVRSADLVLQTGGFSAVVLDMGSVAPEFVTRIELATWHRYRLAAEKTQSIVLLLTQYPCAKSSSELQLRFLAASEAGDEATVFAGIEPHVELVRHRFTQPESNVIPLRKPAQSERMASWQNRTTWAVS